MLPPGWALAAAEDAAAASAPVIGLAPSLQLLGMGLLLLPLLRRVVLAMPVAARPVTWQPEQREVLMTPALIALGILIPGLAAGLAGLDLQRATALDHLALSSLITAPLVVMALARATGPAAPILGTAGPGFLRAGLLAVLAWVLLVPGLLGLIHASAHLYQWLGWGAEEQAWGEVLGAYAGPWWPIAVFSALLIPILEEVAYRGWIQSVVTQRFGALVGVVGTAALFAAFHPNVRLPIFGLALLLGIVRHRTGRLGPCILIHVVHNGAQVAALIYTIESS